MSIAAPRTGWSIQAYLGALVVAVILPLIVLVAFLVVRYAETERDATRKSLIDTAYSLSLDIDRQFDAYESMLRILSGSDLLRRADYAGFRRQADELAKQAGGWILLSDLVGQQHVNTRRPADEPLPQRLKMVELEEVVRTGRTTISGVEVTRSSPEPMIAIDMPVHLDGRIAYVITLGLPAKRVDQLMAEQRFPSEWLIGMVDQAGLIIARTVDGLQLAGSPVRPDTFARLRENSSGWFSAVTRDGVPVYDAFVKSEKTGWSTVVRVPRANLDDPLWRSLAITAAGGLALLLLSAAVALVLGRRIAIPVHALGDVAANLGYHENLQLRPSGVTELDQIGSAFTDADKRLREKRIERDRAEQALREETQTLETLARTHSAIAAELELGKLVQAVTDAAVSLSGAEFGAFFYNVLNEKGESYVLYTLSGAPRSAFEKFPMPRNTGVFEPTFRGLGVVRSDDILKDPRYGKNAPYNGMPAGHLPVRSYLAVPVISRSGEVIGGLFFGHHAVGVFTERAEKLIVGIASEAAIGIDNARLYQAAQREIEERRRAEEALRTLNETLEQRVGAELDRRMKAEEALRQSQKMEAIGQLTGGVAHDFNNLLQVIQGNLEALARRARRGGDAFEPKEALRFTDGALQGVQRSATLVQRLLAFSRRQPLDPKPIEANKLINGMSDLLRRTLGEKITIETVLAGGLWWVSADANQLETALLNLVVNARDAMPDGGKLTIESANIHFDEAYAAAHDVRPGQYIMVAVSDGGIGMSADVAAKAFEPFFTTKDVGQGTGLGLSQVYGFIRQSGGHVKIYSEPGEGTTVKLYLPRLMQDAVPESPVAGPAMTGAAHGEQILVVEDEDRVRESNVEMLGEMGYRAFQAADGSMALRILAENPGIRLLFTDVGLPGGMNGRALADEARRRHKGLKVLFTTGYARNAIVHHGRLDPGVDLIVKPFTFATLAAKIRQVLDGSSAAAD